MPAGCTPWPHAGVASAPTKAPSSLGTRGWGHGGLARAPPELPQLGGEKTREELGRTGQKWKPEVGFTLKNTWPWCRLCLHPGRTASSYSLRASKSRIQLLPTWSPHPQAEAHRVVPVTFNPEQYVVARLHMPSWVISGMPPWPLAVRWHTRAEPSPGPGHTIPEFHRL